MSGRNEKEVSIFPSMLRLLQPSLQPELFPYSFQDMASYIPCLLFSDDAVPHRSAVLILVECNEAKVITLSARSYFISLFRSRS